MEISNRHRKWGFNCPAVDLDFLMLEYNHGKPCALVEYKHRRAATVNPSHATYRALVALADGYKDGPLACFVAIYNPDDWSFRVIPLNESAKAHYAHRMADATITTRLEEHQFVRSLHLLRKRVLSTEDEAAIELLKPVVAPTSPPAIDPGESDRQGGVHRTG